jgi:hypothetical protein
MIKKSLLIIITLILIASIPIGFHQIVYASPSPHIQVSYIYCPSKAYIGEPFTAQVNITNPDLEQHKYTLIWRARCSFGRGYDLHSYGVIDPGDEIALTQPFMFLETTYYFINVTLFEDNQIPVNSTEWTVNVVSVRFAFTHWVDTSPIYPSHTFNVNITVQNIGNAQAYNVNLRLKPAKIMMEKKLLLIFPSPSLKLGNLKAGESNTTQLRFNSTTDIPPGIYLITFNLEYSDERQASYQQTYDVSIEVSSNETVNKVDYLYDIVEMLTASIKSMQNEMQRQWINTLYVSLVLLVVIIFTASLNYYFLKKLKQRKIQR